MAEERALGAIPQTTVRMFNAVGVTIRRLEGNKLRAAVILPIVQLLYVWRMLKRR